MLCRRILSPLLSLVFGFGLARAADDDGFVPLFNGKDLTGWVNVNCAPSTWQFDEEGVLVCTGLPTGEIRTKVMYQNFILELEWRHLVPKGNAGVFVWADAITAKGSPFIRSIEIQVLENAYGNTKNYSTHGDIFPIQGATMVPTNGRGGMRSFPTELLSKPAPRWNHYRIECKDGTVKLWVNGTKVNEGREAIPRKGYICLESEGGIVLYRNVRVKELPDTPIAPEYVAAKSELHYSLYNGVDLSGWKSSSGWVANDWILSNEGGSIATLESESGSGPNRFLFDFSFHPGAEVLQFYPKGKSGPSISVSPGDDGVKKSEEWNRIEGTVEGNTVSYTINGLEQKRTFEHVPEEGSIAFSAKGRIDLANIYLGPDLSVEF